jgi:hypothetical protein
MKKSFLSITVVILLFVLITGGCRNKKPLDTVQGADMLNLTLTTDKDIYTPGEDIRATVVLSNEQADTVLVNQRMASNILELIGDLGETYFVILDPAGEELVFSAHVRVGFPQISDFAELEPGEWTSQRYVLNEDYYIAGKLGVYAVQAIYRNDHDPGDGRSAWKGELVSDVVYFTIVPPATP